MKILTAIIRYILSVILAISMLAMLAIKIFSSTLFSEEYIITKLKEEDYYNKVTEYAMSNFENYIYQSGLDETVLEQIVSKEKVEKDTKIILHNIYDGFNEEISTDEILEKLNQNINQYLGTNASSSQKESIDKFVDTICKEYLSTISHFSFENKLSKGYKTIIEYKEIAKKILIITLVVTVLLLIGVNYNRISNFISSIGCSLTINGIAILIIKYYINYSIKINTITILNTAISNIIRNIINEILNIAMKYGCISLVLGVIIIIIAKLRHSIKKYNAIKERYTQEED